MDSRQGMKAEDAKVEKEWERKERDMTRLLLIKPVPHHSFVFLFPQKHRKKFKAYFQACPKNKAKLSGIFKNMHAKQTILKI